MQLNAEKRDKLGKAVKNLRQEGQVPAELYGKGIKNAHLSVNAKEFEKVFKEARESTMIDLLVDGKKTPVLIQTVQRHFLTDEAQAIDFYRPKLDEKIKVKVPVRFIGEALAVKEGLGIFVSSMEEVEVETLPTDIPNEVEIDISKLAEVGDSITVKDLDLASDKVKVLLNEETAVASIGAKISEEEDAAMGEDTDVEEVEVEGADLAEGDEEKPAEEGAGKPAVEEAKEE